MTSQRISTISPSVSVAWSDATPFTGYYLFILTAPIPFGETASWAELDLNTNTQGATVPFRMLWPITQGVPNASLGLLYNADITPPTTQYVAYLYDSSKRLLTTVSSPFTINATTFTPPTFTLTIPSTSVTPSPD